MPVGVAKGHGGDQTVSVLATRGGKRATEYRSPTLPDGRELAIAARHAVQISSVDRGTDAVRVRGIAYEHAGVGPRKPFEITIGAPGLVTYDLGRVGGARLHVEMDGEHLRALSALYPQ